MTACAVINQTPIAIQNATGKSLPANGLQCSLTCQVSFDYARPRWRMSAVNITNPKPDAKGTTQQLLRFYVSNMNEPVKKDVVFNGRDYQLEFIEFYEQSIHKIPVEGETSSYQYPVEMVMYHSSHNGSTTPGGPVVAPSTDWLAVSVFALPQNSYSLSNTFFYQLLNTTLVVPSTTTDASGSNYAVNSNILSDTSPYVMNVSWSQPTNITQAVVNRPKTGASATSGVSPAIQIQVGQFWSPYQVLPANKAFYSYTGTFPYSASLATPNYGSNNTFTWLLMKNPVSMYNGEYSILQHLFQGEEFALNHSANYPTPCIQNSGNIMYNDGELVGGNADQDKFYVKCVSKESQEFVKSFTQEEEIHQLQELSDQASAGSMFTTYQPPVSPTSGLVFCVVFSLVFFAMFASASWVDASTQSKSADGITTMQHSMIALLCIGLFVLYGMSFATASWMVGAQLFAMLFWTACLVGWTSFAMPRINTYMYNMFNHGPAYKAMGVLMACCSFGPYALILLSGLSSVLLNPMFNLNGQIRSTYSYYYTDVATNPINPTFYIGVKASISINFAGYNLDYRSIGSSTNTGGDTLFVQIPPDFYNPQRGNPTAATSSSTSPPTTPQFMEYNTMPSAFHFGKPSSGTVPTYDPNPSTANINNMLLILGLYDTNMKANHTNPLQMFVNAAMQAMRIAKVYPKTFYIEPADSSTDTKPPAAPAAPPKVITTLQTPADFASELLNAGLPPTASASAGTYYDLVTLLTTGFPDAQQYSETAKTGA